MNVRKPDNINSIPSSLKWNNLWVNLFVWLSEMEGGGGIINGSAKNVNIRKKPV